MDKVWEYVKSNVAPVFQASISPNTDTQYWMCASQENLLKSVKVCKLTAVPMVTNTKRLWLFWSLFWYSLHSCPFTDLLPYRGLLFCVSSRLVCLFISSVCLFKSLIMQLVTFRVMFVSFSCHCTSWFWFLSVSLLSDYIQ